MADIFAVLQPRKFYERITLLWRTGASCWLLLPSGFQGLYWLHEEILFFSAGFGYRYPIFFNQFSVSIALINLANQLRDFLLTFSFIYFTSEVLQLRLATKILHKHAFVAVKNFPAIGNYAKICRIFIFLAVLNFRGSVDFFELGSNLCDVDVMKIVIVVWVETAEHEQTIADKVQAWSPSGFGEWVTRDFKNTYFVFFGIKYQ